MSVDASPSQMRSEQLRYHPRAGWALAAAEGRRLVRHPATLIGLVLSCLAVVSQVNVLPAVHREVIAATVFGAPLALGVFIASHLSTARPIRDGLDELYGITSTRPRHRTVALLGAVAWPTVLALVWAGAVIAYLYAVGGTGRPDPFDVAAIPAVVALAATAGIAVGRWAPRPIASPVAIVAGIALQVAVYDGPGQTQRLAVWADWGPGNPLGTPELWPRDPDVHLVWVLALAGMGGVVALTRHTRRPAVVGAGLLCVVVAVASAVALLRPIADDEIDRLAALAVDPGPQFVCEQRGAAEYCVLPAYQGWIDAWRPHVDGALDVLPDEAAPERIRIELGLGPGPFRTLLDQEEFQAHQAERVTAHPAIEHPTTTLRVGPYQVGRGRLADDHAFGLALDVVRASTGFGGLVPIDEADRGVFATPEGIFPGPAWSGCDARGQAREIVALYLAAVATPQTTRGFRHLVDDQPYGYHDPQEFGAMRITYLNIPASAAMAGTGGFLPRGGTYWSRGAAVLAAQLIDRPEQDVLRTLHADWGRWSDPATDRDELIETLDLEPLPTPEEQLEEIGLDPDILGPLGDDGIEPPCP